MRTITNSVNGQKVPVTIALGVEPLTLMGEIITDGRGEPVMNDRWIYANGHVINRYRSIYCEKMYLSVVTIRSYIGENKLMTKDLKKFVEKVGDKIVFQKYGKWYRIYLRKLTSRTFDIEKIVPYNWTVHPNMNVGGLYAHECAIDWRKKFYI